MPTKFIFHVNMVLVLPLMLLILHCWHMFWFEVKLFWGERGWCGLAHDTKDPLHVPNGPITRSKVKALNGLVVQVLTKAELRDPLEHQEEALVHLFHMQEGSNPSLFRPWSFYNKTTNFVSVFASFFCDVSMCFVDF